MPNTILHTVWHVLIAIALFISPIVSVASPGCDREEFHEFFSRFSNDQNFKDARTHWPLRVTTEQFGEPSTRAVKQIKRANEFWGIKNTASEFLKENQRIKTHLVVEKSRAVVTFAIEDGDILFDLQFKRRSGCWMLTTVRDFER